MNTLAFKTHTHNVEKVSILHKYGFVLLNMKGVPNAVDTANHTLSTVTIRWHINSFCSCQTMAHECSRESEIVAKN